MPLGGGCSHWKCFDLPNIPRYDLSYDGREILKNWHRILQISVPRKVIMEAEVVWRSYARNGLESTAFVCSGWLIAQTHK